ncbi:stage III sporulation protein AF [Aneurinibacillus soli]|uniref:Stage III sporulation protein AF n=1 Tax=Aneurinibacillus soli TaxID=1500254 RepID=A0A0U5B925_9BACL|nr:stage III sporulation protein AF [Aneurinibacillus soli]PYE63647.1 stage III sporulation protein AF [Aneurinibacillus soli]BAU27420.1 Stage III sporulation protein AF [Aneurinibacillus soli]
MMAFLVLWLKKIILLVLLATFLDLLLPGNTYSKYVKLVMGLVILLTMLSPVMELFKKDWPAELSGLSGNTAAGTALDMSRVDALTKQLASHQDETAATYVRTQMSELIKKQVEKQYAVTVENVAVKLVPEGGKAEQPIESIQVTVSPEKTERSEVAASGSGAGMKPVEPVKPVQIEVGANGQTEHTKPAKESVAAMATRTRMEKDIQSSLSLAWNVPDHAVAVQWKSDREGGS